MASSKPKKLPIKEMYCAICHKWLTGYYTNRHLCSLSHKYKLDQHQKTFTLEQPTSSVKDCASTYSETDDASYPVTPTKEQNEKVYDHYRIDGSTLKKCPHNHPSIFHRCAYFDGENDLSNADEQDCHWHAKQKLFEKEQEEQNRYPDMPQPLETFYKEEPETDFDLIDINNADESKEEQENRSNFYREEISEEELYSNLEESDQEELHSNLEESDQEADKECFVSHNNQMHFLTCKICNEDNYKEYINYL